jgi:hypothetical protein
MQPVFFVDGHKLGYGTSDDDRRAALAQHITSADNEWFSRAFVNRIWAELTGEGFYMPIDDLGPERTAQFPEALDLLADGFTDSGYDIQWLYRTIAGTLVYQRRLGSVGGPEFAASPSRLRADQVYNSLTKVLGLERLSGDRGRRGFGPYAGGRDPGRAAFQRLFGYDSSTPQADIVGSVPQALFLMNSPQVNNSLRGDGYSRLARTMRNHPDDRHAITELYLLVLSREPTHRELQINTDYIADVGRRTEAFEDILWCLINSTEFLSKR